MWLPNPPRLAETGSALRDPDVTRDLIIHLGKPSNDELETLATVTDLAQELLRKRQLVTTESVLTLLRATPEYKDKETLAYFSADAVRDGAEYRTTMKDRFQIWREVTRVAA